MTNAFIMLDSIADVKEFVTTVSKYDFDVDLESGRYAIDAKSIMGIFSLDLSKKIKLVAHSNDCADFMAEIEKFVVAE
ncbi:MAG: HPr family phosphocarrier protein [Oscillospiraceae bacterium]|nr:HPr family phosphocarrier protein [Oscillospiraceae bacterium]MBQ8884437.1 HPr family phosphocarrier protein [Oscillospiraceae bacterium]